jgi:two-component system response regulator
MNGVAIPKRVVLVDDSWDEAEFVRRALMQRCPDAELRVFRRGMEAVRYLTGSDATEGRTEAAGLVMLDLKLPGHGGHSVLRELRERYAPGELPVVIFSSSREPSDVAKAYRLGANSYVVKPMVHEEYVEVVGLVARYWLDVNVLKAGDAGADHA